MNFVNSLTYINTIAVTNTSTTFADSHAKRVGLYVVNNSNGNLFLRFGDDPATTSNYTIRLAAGSTYELPYQYFTGTMMGIWETKSDLAGSAQVTQILDK